jgi:polyhydroxybutyrate depolymerase
MRDALRRRMMARAGLVAPDLPVQSLEVQGVARTFAAVPGPGPDAPLLLVLHGAGGTGLGMAALSGLAQRGPAAGCAVAFPDGFMHVWNDRRGAPLLARREGVDDVAFLQALVEHLRPAPVGADPRVFAVGMSNGGFLSEYVARQGLLDLAGVALVASSATVASRSARPVPTPVRPLRFLAFHGTADPLVPYGGGPIGPLGRLAERVSGRKPAWTGRGMAAPIEDVAADWAQALPRSAAAPPPRAGVLRPVPHTERVGGPPGDLGVERLSWPSPDGAPAGAVLYRIEGGGHTWPGGAAYLPARIVGPVARHLDATGILLDFVTGRPEAGAGAGY